MFYPGAAKRALVSAKTRELRVTKLHFWKLARSRDSKGISKLPQIQLILPYKISWIKGSSEIPLISLHSSLPHYLILPHNISCIRGSLEILILSLDSSLPQIQLILPYNISCIRVSLEIPLLSLEQGLNVNCEYCASLSSSPLSHTLMLLSTQNSQNWLLFKSPTH